jgi:lipoprotein-anchoring transpeptidase ErfK/SrfK
MLRHDKSAFSFNIPALPGGPALTRLALAMPMVLGLSLTALAQSGRGGNLGGGFIEYLMTGESPTRRQGAPAYRHEMPQYYSAPGGARVIHVPRGYAPEFGEPAPRHRVIQQQAIAVPDLEDDPYNQPEFRRRERRDHAPAPVQPGVDPRFEKQEVSYPGRHAPGTIIIDTPNKFLYLVQGNGRALRYGIGVGRPGFEWAGVKSVTLKREWPDWRPPAQMLKRRPDLPRHMAGGPDNPLGARALYLGSSLYRIHGTNEPATIGRAVSSGCIRMRNQDVIDLYGRVRVGTKVVVI